MKKLLKKLISVSLAAMMSVMAVPITQDTIAFAVSRSTKTKLDIGSIIVGLQDASDEVSIPIKIENLWIAGAEPNLKNCQLVLIYDDELSFESREKGLMNPICKNDKSTHTITIDASADTPINEDGVLFTLGFKLPENLGNKVGYDISSSLVYLENEDGDEISSSVSDGYIEYQENMETEETINQINPLEIVAESAEIPAMAGEEVSIPVTISDNIGISGTMFSFEFDSRLKYLDTTWGIINGTDAKNDISSTEGMSILSIVSASASNNDENGVLFTLNFEVPEDVKENDVYNVNITKASVFDSNYNELKFVTKSAKLTVRNNNILPDPTDVTEDTTEPETSINITTKPVQKKEKPDSLSVASVVEYGNVAGKKVNVPIYIENNSGFATSNIVFKYDTRLTVNTANLCLSSNIQGSFIPFVNTEEGTITIISASESNVKTDGNVFWLSFILPNDAAEGDIYPIKIDSVPNWGHINEKGEDGYVRGSITYKALTVTSYDGSISIEKEPVTTAATYITTETTTTNAQKAEDDEEQHLVPIQPLTVNSKNIISIPPVHIAPEDAGQKITIPVYISKNEGFASAGFLISYDNRLAISSSDIKTTNYLKASTSKFAFDNIKIVSIAIAGIENTYGDVAICNMSFTVPSNAKSGDKFDVSIKEIHCWDHLLLEGEVGYDPGFTTVKELPISVINGYIMVDKDSNTAFDNNNKTNQDNNLDIVTPSTSLLLGDADLNGKVDAKDAVLVLKEYATILTDRKYQTILKTNADVNFDGRYDSADAVFILQYYAAKLTGYTQKMDPFMESRGYKKR